MYIATFKPSQWINIGYILFGVALAPITMGISLLVPLWKIIEVYFIEYELSDDRIIYRRGVFSVTTDEVLLYRIKGLNLHRPFLYRFVGISILTIRTSDPYVQQLTMTGIPMGPELRETLREFAEYHREVKGIREFDGFPL